MNKENRKIIDQLNFAVGAVTEAGCYLNSGLVEADNKSQLKEKIGKLFELAEDLVGEILELVDEVKAI